MIRVVVKASSPATKARLEALPNVNTVPESDAEVLVAEAGSIADPEAQEALDWASAGGPAVLLTLNPVESLTEALRAGVKAVLSSNASESEIAAAIEAAAAGLVVLEASGVETLFGEPANISRAGTLIEPLTPREIEVLQLVATGLGNKEIAARLGISEHTIKFHVASVMGKLGATSRTEAVTLGIRKGLLMI